MRPGVLCLSLIFFLVASSIAGQGKTTKNEQMVWVETTTSFKLNDRISGLLLYQHRFFLDREFTHQNVYWLSAAYGLNEKLSLGAGYMYFRYRRMVGEGYLSVPEVRPFQFLTYKTGFGKVNLVYRFMLEQRFQETIENERLSGEHLFSMRFRNRIRASYPISNKVKLVLSEELLLSNHNDLFNQNRASLRAYYQIGKASINAGYFHWLVNTPTSIQHRHTLLVGANLKL